MKPRHLILCFVIGALVGLYVHLIQSCSKHDIQCSAPTAVDFKELVEETDEYSVYSDYKYALESITYDTVPDRVDLNEIFDPRHEGDTDWNYTEIDDDGFRYLDSLGIYWDERYGCYRKHK